MHGFSLSAAGLRRGEMLELPEANTCIRGCCTSDRIPLHLPPSSFVLLSEIGRGSEAVIYEATLYGTKVAAKMPLLSTSDELDKFHKELQLLCELDHPRLATLIAAHAKPPHYTLFFPLYEHRNLAEKIHLEEWNPSISQALSFTLDLAKALQYLHSLGIVHRDVKPANILLDDALQPHLADFGLAAYMEELKNMSVQNWISPGKPTGGFHKQNIVGTLIYMAPELLGNDVHTEKSDVYSFAISINELLTGVVPYTDLSAEAQAHTVLEMRYTRQELTAAIVSEGLRPVLAGFGNGGPQNLLSLIQRCWDADPQNRPSFDIIIQELNSIMKHMQIEDKEYNALVRPSFSSAHLIGSNTCRELQESNDWLAVGDPKSILLLDGHSGLKTWVDSSNVAKFYCPTLSWGSFSTCGRRETMEDTYFMLPYVCGMRDIHVFGIFDGHRGAEAAEFSACMLPRILLDSGSANSCPSKALSQAFMQTDIAFRNEMALRHKSRRVQKDRHPGCTACVALIVKDKLFVANAGDCRAILCGDGLSHALTRGHVASCTEERERVAEAGGHVTWQIDTWRVGEAALQVTRSIGDDDLKPAVSAQPEIKEISLSKNDECLVMASDGLWDVVSDEEVLTIIRHTVKEAEMCSKRLATLAAEHGSKDNITVIVVFLRPISTAERIY